MAIIPTANSSMTVNERPLRWLAYRTASSTEGAAFGARCFPAMFMRACSSRTSAATESSHIPA
ncbi:hypothetical protein D3C81_2176820 [compost metagenome]